MRLISVFGGAVFPSQTICYFTGDECGDDI